MHQPIEPVKPPQLDMPVEFQFEVSKWTTMINECNDLEAMRAIAVSAIHFVYATKTVARQLNPMGINHGL